ASRPAAGGAPYRDHWDLAYDRCKAVRDFLVGQGIDPRRIRLGVAGENEPLDSDDDPVPARQNSRVDIHHLNEYVSSPAGVENPRPGK
ncbi:MAG: OmpA family protein, partial [Thermoguttaceae bacterium]|nr:OmpA family protein [Thermoguttaceae bacterium]